MIINLLGGSWGRAIRQPAEAAAVMLPLLAVLFVPIAIGAARGTLFPWGNSSDWRSDPILVHRHDYLNVWFFVGRAVIYAICWITLAYALRRGTRSSSTLYAISGPGLLLYVLTMGLFASTDWILSLEPHYKSTVFGLLIVAGQGVSSLCVLIAASCMLCPHGELDTADKRDALNDLATLLLIVTMLCCYLNLCQFVINWMGNTQGENRWYIHRLTHGWLVLSGVIVLLHLVMPLLLLSMRAIKRNPTAMVLICLTLLIARGIDGFVMINASGGDSASLLRDRFSWLDVALPIGMGGVWMVGFLWMVGRVANEVETSQSPVTGAVYAG